MGDPKKQRKSYDTPRHPWRTDQLEVELRLVGEYGLRNKRELWRYKTMLSEVRGIARSLLGETEEQRARVEHEYLAKLHNIGVLPDGASIDEILDLEIRDLLERRLQTVVFRRGLAKSFHQARQLVSHGHISVSGEIVSVPGYMVKREEEQEIKYFAHSVLAKADHPTRKAMPSQVEQPAPVQ
ncbi:MAG TPA: 30S ribosomal protein S4 [Candidatus Saccharimonadales bacterium]|nr:30S ribosomal protein S4 [Candidatus Saccharimonadales bacterium]